MSNRGHSSTSSCSISSRCHRLTEAERELRRIRRLIANRESAMRSIHRRRSMREDLIRNATELAMENRNLKKEKEQSVEELNHLKRKNERLKAMMEKVKKDEVNREGGEAPPMCILPFYSFFPLQMECLSQSSRNEECFNVLTTPSSTRTDLFHHPEVSDRQHEGGIGFDLNESCNDGNTTDGKELTPSAMNCYVQSSSSTMDK